LSESIVSKERVPSARAGRNSRKNSGVDTSAPATMPMQWPMACWRGLAPSM
jgi:hypothetical protein